MCTNVLYLRISCVLNGLRFEFLELLDHYTNLVTALASANEVLLPNLSSGLRLKL